MKIYTNQYMIDNYDYVNDSNYNMIICVCSDDNDCCYCCDIDDNGNYHVFGGKFEVYNGDKPVDISTVCDLFDFELCDKITLQNIVLHINDIDAIKSICSYAHVLFNDEIIEPYAYSCEHVNKYVNINECFNVIAFEIGAIGLFTILVTDNNNTSNQYRIVVNACDNKVGIVANIQYVEYETGIIFDLISVIINETIPHLMLINLSDLINMSLHYYMNVLKYSIDK